MRNRKLHSNQNSSQKELQLPPLSAEAQAQSEALCAKIRARMQSYGGVLPFVDFMRMALYEPGYGYYTGGSRKFGAAGDFVTAPEISSLFAAALANQCIEVLRHLPRGVILEVGAGSGRMAVDLLNALARQSCLPRRYYILEVSADLCQRQFLYLQAAAPQLLERVEWLTSLENLELEGVVLANEVLDAMPVECFYWDEPNLQRVGVACRHEHFVWETLPVTLALQQAFSHLLTELPTALPSAYRSEINLLLPPWFRTLWQVMRRGIILCCDYGYPRKEYYLPERSDGTLLCYYRHRVHADPLCNVGVQDISAHVDFTAVAEAASAAGFELQGFTSQMQFLTACDIETCYAELTQHADEQQLLVYAQQIKSLMLPGEMGERFKVMALSRNFSEPLCGFSRIDYSSRL